MSTRKNHVWCVFKKVVIVNQDVSPPPPSSSSLSCQRTAERKLRQCSKESNKIFMLFYMFLSTEFDPLLRIFCLVALRTHALQPLFLLPVWVCVIIKVIEPLAYFAYVNASYHHKLKLIQGKTIIDRKRYNEIRCECDVQSTQSCL